MSFFLVRFTSPVHIATLDADQLQTFQDGISRLKAKGSMKAAYSNVGGGGLVFILESESNAHLALELRKHFITDAEVTPLIPLEAEIDAHITFRKTQVAAI